MMMTSVDNDDDMDCIEEEEEDETMRETSYRFLWPTHADVKVHTL